MSTANTPSRTTTEQTTPKKTHAKQKPYDALAQELPHPKKTFTGFSPVTSPAVATDYTIPNDTLSPENIPFNSEDTHWRAWRSKFATIASLYVIAARHYHADTDMNAVHVMMSPPPDDVQTRNDITHWKEKAISTAKENNIYGGVAAFHGYRVNKNVADTFDSLIADTDLQDNSTSVLLWEWIRRTDNPKQYLEWGPHIHITGLTDTTPTEQSHKGTGVFEHLRTFPEYDRSMPIECISAHRSVSKDMLDHVTFDPSSPGQPLEWFGSLKGSTSRSARQLVSDAALDGIREQLINGPSIPPGKSSVERRGAVE